MKTQKESDVEPYAIVEDENESGEKVYKVRLIAEHGQTRLALSGYPFESRKALMTEFRKMQVLPFWAGKDFQEVTLDELEVASLKRAKTENHFSSEQHTPPLMVNFYAGPSAGKSVAALELAAALKKAGYNAEYVSEFAKDLVLEGRTDELKDQKKITDTQYKWFDRLRGSVDIIVTDSPVLLGLVYGEGKISEEYAEQIRGYYDTSDNFNMLMTRPKNASFQKGGRIHDEQQSIELDGKIKSMLEAQKVFYGTYKRDDIAKTVERIGITFNRLYGGSNTTSNKSKPKAKAEEIKHKKENEEMANDTQKNSMSNSSTTTVVGRVAKYMELKQVTVDGETKTVGNMSIVATRSGTTKDGKPWERMSCFRS